MTGVQTCALPICGIASVRSDVLQAPTGFAAPLYVNELELVEVAPEQLVDKSAMAQVAARATSFNDVGFNDAAFDDASEFLLVEIEQCDVAPTRDVVDMIFDVDQLDDLLSELLSQGLVRK